MKEKLKKLYDNYSNIIFTFLAALIVIIIVYYLKDIKPFGKNSLLAVDFFHQYGPMLGELYNRVMKGYNLIYSFSMGMGLPFFRNFFNYLSSPFNIILFLFKHNNLIMSYSFIIGLKAIFSSVTMYYYISKKFNMKSLYFSAFSLFYGFSSYFVAYYWNIMWLDGMVFLPLIVLGIEKLINEDKPLLYIITLTTMLFANYFIAYMLCIFSVIYFIGYLIIYLEKIDLKLIIKKILYFIASSLIVGALAAWFLLPMYYTLKSISATGDVFPTSQYYSFTLINFLLKHLSGANLTVFKSDTFMGPNISTGILSFALFILFIINPKIKIKIKLVYISILLFLTFSFFNGPLDYIWHAFHVPNDLPFRYSFIYSFIFVLIGVYSLVNIKYLKQKYISIVYIIIMILISLLYFSDYNIINKNILLLNLIVLTAYFILYFLYCYINKFKRFIPIIFIITIIIESTIVINNNWNIDQNLDNFYNNYADTQKTLNYIRKYDKEMYRIEKTERLTLNDPSWYNYYGQTTFSSMEYKDLVYLQCSLGIPGNGINSFYYKQTTPIYDLMYNIKYIIDTNNNINNLYYSHDYKDLYKNNYILGLMFGVNENIKNWNILSDNPFEIQNDFIKKSTNIDIEVFKNVAIYSKETIEEENFSIMKYTIKNPGSNIYFYFNRNIDFAVINSKLYYLNKDFKNINRVSDIDIIGIQEYNEKYIINTNTDNEYYTFYIKYDNYIDDNFYIYTLDYESFDKVFNFLNNNKINITDFKENYIEANGYFYENMIVYTSIPYDDGWQVYVDNKKVNTIKIGNALLSFDINEGYHKIKLKYHIPYLNVGLVISITSLLLVISYLIYKKRNKS